VIGPLTAHACVFCNIVAGEIPSSRIAESTNFLAFLDLTPIAPGHALVIPKKHATNFLELPEYLGNELVEFTQRVAEAVVRGTGAQGFNLQLANGAAAEQSMFHMHLHIIPRREDDGLRGWQGHASTPEQRTAMRERIIAQFR